MNITIGRYHETPELRQFAEAQDAALVSDTWESWIEPEDRSWILFVGVDGTPAFFPNRDENGGVITE